MPVNTNFVDGRVLYAENLSSSFANSVSILGDSMIGPLTVLGMNLTFSIQESYNTANAAYAKSNISVSTISTGSIYNVVPSDYAIVVNKTIGSPTTINLLGTPPISGSRYIIKDGKGDCSTNNITINANSGSVMIDGSTSYILNINRQSVELLWDSNQYNII